MIVVITTKDNGLKGINKVGEKRFTIVAVYTRENIIKTWGTAMVQRPMRTEVSMKENGHKDSRMVEVKRFLVVAVSIKVTTLKIWDMVMENIILPMVVYIKEIGLRTWKREEHNLILMENFLRVTGKMGIFKKKVVATAKFFEFELDRLFYMLMKIIASHFLYEINFKI